MGLVILLVILGALGVGLVAARRVRYSYGGGGGDGWVPTWQAGVVLIVLALGLLGFGSAKSVGAREVGIPVTFGHIGGDLQPGVHWLAPWTSVHTCSLAQQQSIQTQASTEGDTSGGDGIAINGSDQGQATADTTVLYHFDPAHAQFIFRKYGCSAALVKSNLIRQALKGAVPQVAARYLAVDLKNQRQAIQDGTIEILNRDFAGDGIIVDSVILSRIDLSPVVQDAANNKLQAQQAAQTAQFHLQQAQVDQQTQLVQGQAASAANAAKTASLTPQILCEDWIQAIKGAQVVMTGGPCGGSAAAGSSVLIQPGARAGS